MHDLNLDAHRDELGQQFPMVCVLKVIARDVPGMAVLLETAINDTYPGIQAVPGNHSRSGTYLTFNLSAHFQTLEEMETTVKRLAAVEGVKLVL